MSSLKIKKGDTVEIISGDDKGEESAALLEGTRGELVELLGDRDVLLVRRDHEAGMREVLDLSLHRLDDARVTVAHRGHRDAGAEVDELVAVDVDEDAALALDDVGRQAGADPGGDGGVLARRELG